MLTFVCLYASSAVHSAIAVGLLNAMISGFSLSSAIKLRTFGVNVRGTAAAPSNAVHFVYLIICNNGEVRLE